MRIHVLCDDVGRPGFGSEHGLSLALSLEDGSRWLWDTGQSGLFLDTARTLGVDVRSFAGVALSHGHYDHAGGLGALLRAGFAGPIHAHPAFAAERWKFAPGAPPRSIGLDLAGLPAWPLPGFTAVSGRADLAPQVVMLTDIPRLPGSFQSVDGYFFDLERTRPDPVADDACLVVGTPRGFVLVLGCCHSGLANTLRAVRETLGVTRLYAMVGGLHLLAAPAAAVEEAAELLREFAVERVCACHCTGPEAMEELGRRLPGRVRQIGAGEVLEM